MQNVFKLNDFIEILKIADTEIDKNKQYLSNLDSVIGDGDHGITISTAFSKINNEISSRNFDSIPDLFKFVGNLFITSIGGTTGPIFGYIFIGMASSLIENKKMKYLFLNFITCFLLLFRKLPA